MRLMKFCVLHFWINVYDMCCDAEMLSPRSQSGLEAKILASEPSASKLWPRPRPWPQTFGLGLASVCSRRTSSQEEIDRPICLPTTGHHTMIEDSYCARENEKLNCVVLIIMI